ncbi:MAG: type I restriction enzyme HsdR N-terminal domain-containing protein [Chloroflexi bacterium]|nr:type I restriction enzyme HsdR N-terminal domain-containing protein [Chloroflexota bacterium]
MDFADRIRQLVTQIPKQIGHIQTEEATKNALVMPFIQALGYNVFDPTEVVPELVSDFGTKKGEKVDYAILRDGKPIMLFECKTIGTNLGQVHTSQLFRYFTTTESRFGVLTNGIEYWFFSDLERANMLDEKPFLIVNLMEIDDSQIEELKKFSKSMFDVDQILDTASELKYTREIKKIIAQQLKEPDDDIVRLLAGRVFSGRVTQKVRDDFGIVVKKAFQQFLNDKINERLQSAMQKTSELPAVEASEETVQGEVREESDDSIVTTQEEIEAYMIVKSILREVINPKRVAMRDLKTYCGVLLDDNNRKPICRLHFHETSKYIGLFNKDKNEERVAIEEIDDIYKYADRLKETITYYES